MADISAVEETLQQVMDPELNRSIVDLGMVHELALDGHVVSFTLALTTMACPLRGQMEDDARERLMSLEGVDEVRIQTREMTTEEKESIFGPQQQDSGSAARFNRIKYVIAVLSGKGGVGKSTISALLAVALRRKGHSVGLLDADITGPNIPLMLGLDHMPPPQNEKLIPPEAFGVKVMSMAFLVPPGQPVIWRGPMLHSAIRQFFSDVLWGDLDYMVIDLPPGTGDVQLSLAQSVPLTGGIIVTTPQEVAVIDARKGLATFKQLEVPVLGIVENMGAYTDPQTGAQFSFFGEGGGERMAKEYEVPFLGSIPLDPQVRVGGDSGLPVVVQRPDSRSAEALVEIAQRVAAQVSVLNVSQQDVIPLQVIG